MEVSGAVLRRSMVCAGAGTSSSYSIAGSGRTKVDSRRTFAVAVGGGGGRGFSDEGHLSYYVAPARCGKKKEEEVKRKKLVKGLSRDPSALCAMGASAVLAGELKGHSISEAAQILLAQLEQLRIQEKEMRRKKEEKIARKVTKMKSCNARDESSSSSSESSDSECEEVINMRNLGTLAVPDAKFGNLSVEPVCNGGDQPPTEGRQQGSTMIMELEDCRSSAMNIISSDSCCGSNSLKPMQDELSNISATSVVSAPKATYEKLSLPSIELVGSSGAEPLIAKLECRRAGTSIGSIDSAAIVHMDKVEVCMGGKCKRSGALELMAEFERRIGNEAAVVGCKCMGKCKQGPNVRVSVQCDPNEVSKNSLCTGVGVEDVGTIMANFFEEKKGVGGLMAA